MLRLNSCRLSWDHNIPKASHWGEPNKEHFFLRNLLLETLLALPFVEFNLLTNFAGQTAICPKSEGINLPHPDGKRRSRPTFSVAPLKENPSASVQWVVANGGGRHNGPDAEEWKGGALILHVVLEGVLDEERLRKVDLWNDQAEKASACKSAANESGGAGAW